MSAAQIVYQPAGYQPAAFAHAVYGHMLPTCILPTVRAVGAALPIHQPAQHLIRSAPRNIDIYRPYTEAILRRYLRMAMEVGKVPSLIGQEMFRSKITNDRVGNFDDAVIFVHDVDRCLDKLEPNEKLVITHLALQQYNVDETARLLRLNPRTVIRRYGMALDKLTKVFLDVKMLEPLKYCQAVQM
jgi:Sigma-70, region 4